MASVTESGTLQGSGYLKNPDASSGGDQARSGAASTAADLAHMGKERAKELGDITRERVIHKVDDRKSELVQGLHELTSTLENASRDLSSGIARQAIDSVVGVLHKATDRIENETTSELLSDVQERIRERPAFFVAGCLALGFVAGRILKV